MCYQACDHEEIPKSAVLQIIGPCKILNYIFMHLRQPRVTDPRLNGTDRCGADQKPLANEDDIYDSQIFSAIFQILFTQMILFHRRKERTLSYAIFMKIIISFSYITCIFFNLHRNTNTCIFIPAQFTLYVHFSFYLFDYRPVTAHSDNLGRCRTLQLVVVRKPVVFPRSVDCLPQSQVHASGQQQRRLSDPLYKEMQTRM